MKKILYSISALAALAFLWTGCTQYTEYEPEDTGSVEELLYPADGFELTLINNANAKLNFEWKAVSGGSPLYSVIFYGPDGTSELARYNSDDNGSRNMLSLPHRTVTELADIAGIGPEETGDLYWTAVAVNGENVQSNIPAPRKLTVTRDASSVSVPYELYITGEGSEAGQVLADALPMDKISDGVFELYTRISGPFSFVNRNGEGAKREFFVAEDGKLTEDSEEAVSLESGVYRINVDFNKSAVVAESIDRLELRNAGGSVMTELAYSGGGEWKAVDYTVPTDGDDRYRFMATVAGAPEIWGSDNTDRDAQDPGTIDPSSTYFNIGIHTDEAGINDSYRSIFKFHSPLKGVACTIVVSMNGGRHYHYFDMGFELVAPAVTELQTPQNNASIRLNAMEGSKELFSWAKPADAPQVPFTTYSLVFFRDAQGTDRVTAFGTSYDTSIELTHLQLEDIAASAGIEAEGDGVIYWGVESSLIGNTTISTVINTLNISRLRGVPGALYVTGEASEFGTGFGQMKMLSTGNFEIYTRLTSGMSYSFTDNVEGGRTFVINGTSFNEVDEPGVWNDETGIYRITINAISNEAKVESIGRVYMEVCAYPESNFTLEYTGNGIWEAKDIVPDFTREASWNGDTRFFVKMVIDGKTWKIANQKDFGGSDPTEAAPERSPEYTVRFWDDDTQYDYHYKVIQAYRGQNTKALNIKLNCSPQEEFYYVYLEYLD